MGFERCHPAVNLIFFAAVIACTVSFLHPVFLALSFLCAYAYSVYRGGKRAALFGLALIPFIIAFALFYSSYHHFGVTILGYNGIGNAVTLEPLAYGAAIGCAAAGVMLWLSCVYSVFTADKVVYLFGRISPKLSLFLAILLRMVPRIKIEARRITTARRGIGRGCGGLWPRIRNGIAVFSILITWTADALMTASTSMRSRGSLLRGRTAFSIYRFDNRDRAFVIWLFTCLTVVLMGALLRQTDMQYDPRLRLPTVTPMACLFYLGYLSLCLSPLTLELYTAYRFHLARQRSL